MIYIGKYRELYPDEQEYPYMKDNFEAKPYEGKDKIIYYLKHGKEDMRRPEIPKDIFTGEHIGTVMTGRNDGEYTWWDTLAYYVEKYNLRLPKEFEKKILSSNR